MFTYVSEWLLLNAKCGIFRLHCCEKKLHFDAMMSTQNY